MNNSQPKPTPATGWVTTTHSAEDLHIIAVLEEEVMRLRAVLRELQRISTNAL